jgi:hypothetical protein
MQQPTCFNCGEFAIIEIGLINNFLIKVKPKMGKAKKIIVEKLEITVFSMEQAEYISLTDMARYRDAERTNYIIQNWMRTRNAIEFCGLWEQMNNSGFKSIEFDAFKMQPTGVIAIGAFGLI